MIRVSSELLEIISNMPSLDVMKRWKRKRRKANSGKTSQDGILRLKAPTMLYGIWRLRKKRNPTEYDYNH